MNATIDLLKHHTSIRKFNTLPVTEEEEGLILECAMQGATAGNMMQYHIIVIRNQATLAALGKSCDDQPFIASAQVGFLFLVDNHKWQKFFEGRGVRDHGVAYKGPEIPDMMLGMQDAMIAGQNAVVAAESMGIGTCYIGDIMEQVEAHKEMFNLPDFTMAATLIVMGRYDHKPSVRQRFNKRYIVSKETYPKVDNNFVDGMFGPWEEGKPDFAQKFYTRKIEADFFKEMIRSIKVSLKQWL